jgi:hypothetical protein
MSPEELPVLAGLVASATVLTIRRVRRLCLVTSLSCGPAPRLVIGEVLGGYYVALWLALTFFAAEEVRASMGYRLMFLAAGVLLLELVAGGIALLGLDSCADGLERNNAAARIAFLGLCVGCMVCAIGANIGEGDDIGSTFVPLALCALGLLGSGLALAAGSRGYANVTIEHDVRAGVRLGASFIGVSLPLSQAASGDWESLEATLTDFGSAVPWVSAIVALSLAMEAWLRRSRRPAVGTSSWAYAVIPAASNLLLGAVAVSCMR